MSRATQNLVLLLVGASTVVMLVRGTYVNYVKPGLFWWLVVAAAVLVALGLAAVVRDVRDVGRSGEHGHGHGHAHGSRLAWLLLVPIALVAFVVPPALDARGVTAAPPVRTTVTARDFPPLPGGPAPTVGLPEVVMRAAASTTLDGRDVTVTGFTLHYPDGVYLARVVIVCCAADAQLARIRLAGTAADAAAGFGEQTWISVRGRIEPGSATPADDYVPTFDADAVTRIDKPANVYAY